MSANEEKLLENGWEIEPFESIEERIACGGYETLTAAECTYHAAWRLLNFAYGLGLKVYFDVADRAEIEKAVEWLTLVEAVSIRETLLDGLGILPENYFTVSVEYRSGLLTEYDEDLLYEASGTLQSCKFPHAQLTKFTTDHKDAFRGPRTKLELWRSMHERGADTSPRFVAKQFERAIDAEKDRAYSSRSCPHCDYPSPDYRPSCKSCGYPHGRA